MELSGVPIEIDRGVKNGERRPSLTIMTPPMTTAAEDWHDYDEQSAVLIILPKWIAFPMPLKTEWVMKAGAFPPGSVAKMLQAVFSLIRASRNRPATSRARISKPVSRGQRRRRS